jgi:hypothetical protein
VRTFCCFDNTALHACRGALNMRVPTGTSANLQSLLRLSAFAGGAVLAPASAHAVLYMR